MTLRAKRSLYFTALAALLAAAILFSFFGKAETAYAENGGRTLYIVQTAIDNATGTAYAYIGFSGDEGARLNTKASVSSSTVKDGAWYFVSKAEYSFPYAELYSEISLRIAQDGRLPEGTQYSQLKIVAVYDTIYKRLKSNASVTANGKYRSHRLELSEENNALKVSRTTANTANWYTLLVSCGLIFIAAAITTALAIKGNAKWKRTKE